MGSTAYHAGINPIHGSRRWCANKSDLLGDLSSMLLRDNQQTSFDKTHGC